MSDRPRLSGLLPALIALLALGAAGPAFANLCTGNFVDPVHRIEAEELRGEDYSSGNNCAAGSETCWLGSEDYDAMVIACNRKRDVKPFEVGFIKDLPLLHGPAGKTLDDRNAAQRQFGDNLPPRAITGQIQYLGMFPKWYGYILERENGNWIATTVIQFKFPNAEKNKLHLPAYLAARLSSTQGGRPLTETVCATASTGKNDNGMIIENWGRPVDRACRINRDAKLFLIDDRDRTDLDYIDETKGFTEALPAKRWIMYYWRAVVESVWTRPDRSFQMKVVIANLAGRPGEVTEGDLDLLKKADLVYELEFHHKEGRSNNMYRPVEVLGLKVYKATYAGLWPTGVAHEFGHSLGLDDEYPQNCDNNAPPGICNAKPNKDCQRLSGFITGVDTETEELAYAMCDEWDRDGDLEYPDEVFAHSVKSVYPWIVSQRYSIGEEIPDCDEDSDCANTEWCKKLGGINRCVAKLANGEGCHRPNQCLSGLCPAIDLKCAACTEDEHCENNEFCKTAKVLSQNTCERKHRIGESCSRPDQCFSGICPAIDLVCGECNDDSDCANDEWCKSGTPGSANTCEPKLANGVGCTRPKQCVSGLCPAPDFKCSECTNDDHCESDEFCNEGTVGIGANSCDVKKRDGLACSRPNECQSGLCPAPDFKCSECTNDGHCESDEFCNEGTLGIGANSCDPKKRDGLACSRPSECQSGLCPAPDFKCSECTNDSHCESDEFCNEGTVGIGANSCDPKKRDGLGCSRPSECQSGLCPAPDFKCAECTSDSHCESDEYCKKGTAGIGANECVAKKRNGEGCTGPAQCQSGLCPAPDFKCVECTSDGHCDNDEYCDEGTLGIGENQCKNKKNEGTSCSRNNQCKSGCCKLFNFKVQCRPSSKC
ncbi:MAG: Dickkopf N-terminal cysteine-rich domain-containing protein [Thermoanaerobaculia bacterium]